MTMKFQLLLSNNNMKIREAMDNNGPGDICGATVRNKDEELKTFWESSEISYGGLHEVVARPT